VHTDNKSLAGPFAPWAEENEAYDLKVDGQIPEDRKAWPIRRSSSAKTGTS
jgi:carotenoid cleavage dioxygenase